jgi:hypothetical protein
MTEWYFWPLLKLDFLNYISQLKKNSSGDKKLGKFNNHMDSKDTKYHMVVTR